MCVHGCLSRFAVRQSTISCGCVWLLDTKRVHGVPIVHFAIEGNGARRYGVTNKKHIAEGNVLFVDTCARARGRNLQFQYPLMAVFIPFSQNPCVTPPSRWKIHS
jgi:hypothetical protein